MSASSARSRGNYNAVPLDDPRAEEDRMYVICCAPFHDVMHLPSISTYSCLTCYCVLYSTIQAFDSRYLSLSFV